MSAIAVLPGGYRRRREKVFGDGRGHALDRNAKARIIVYAKAYSARHKRPGQHRGPLTRATLEVLEALLWGFHNQHTGRCFPSYETIAARAQCCRDTVYEAIRALEAADILTWVNRLVRVQFREIDLFGKVALRSRLIRTSNAYTFRDPLPCAPVPEGRGGCRAGGDAGTGRGHDAELRAAGAPPVALSSKSENPPRTQNQDFYHSFKAGGAGESDQPGNLELALARLKSAMERK